MRQSEWLIPTLKEVPADAEASSHRLLLKAGYIRQLAAGIYTYLPLGRRVLRKMESIVREEMDATGAQELLMPSLQPMELWEESGRASAYGPELIRLTDRNGRGFALGPTHEEVVTALVRQDLSSYKSLPITLYQIQTKFRDERRPRFGLLRCREFLMKDAYSFHADEQSLDRSYRSMRQAYERIFRRVGLEFVSVEADSGAIGGEGGSHEYMALAASGEDTLLVCPSCGYGANVEAATSGPAMNADCETTITGEELVLRKVHTPEIRTISELCDFLSIAADRIIKTLLYSTDTGVVAVLLCGDREANEIKLRKLLGTEHLELADAATVERVTGAPSGFAGPVGLSVHVLADPEVMALKEALTGANEPDWHYAGVVPGRDFIPDQVGECRNAEAGDACPHCGTALSAWQGIEVGHVFKLGTKYSSKLDASFTGADGARRPMLMGCYGIGVSRLLAAVAEQHSDASGFHWPTEIAPFHIHLLLLSPRDERQRELAEEAYAALTKAGYEVLLDDREERPGSKFHDADLIGLPLRLIVGKAAGDGWIEVADRGGKRLVAMASLLEEVDAQLRSPSASRQT
ncbi:proline--tRNA ligase [Gorillibacterium timonense]|uniref:proline--tRNA ligase n=1 Tax=Gorillibacterium timonense TaxID=1689269 RepID=UPI00071C7998